MNNHFEKLLREAAGKTALTHEERARMRTLLAEYAALKPVREKPAPHAVFSGARAVVLRLPAFAALVLTIGLGAFGVAYAAEGALPGDVLYPMKVAVTEPLRLAFSSANEQAPLHLTFAEERLKEAAALARSGRLTGETETALAQNFSENAQAALRLLAKEPAERRIEETKFSARLAAYGSVLKAVGTSTPQSPALDLRARVELEARAFSDAPEVATLPHEPIQKTDAVETIRLGFAADRALERLAETLAAASSTLTASSSESARLELERASKSAAEGRAFLDAHDAAKAAKAFQDSLSATARLDVLTRSAATLKLDLFTASSSDASSTSAASSAAPTEPASDSSRNKSPAGSQTPPSPSSPLPVSVPPLSL